MKITIDRTTITLMKQDEAKQMIKDWSGTLNEKSIMKSLTETAFGKPVDSVQVNKLSVTLNRYELTIWAETIVFSHDTIAYVSFDVLQANENKRDAYIQEFKRAESYCT